MKVGKGRSPLCHSAHLFIDLGLPPDYESQVFESLDNMSGQYAIKYLLNKGKFIINSVELLHQQIRISVL